MDDEKRLPGIIRGASPCRGCTERLSACWGNCTKDARGEYGYKAWKADLEDMKAKKKAYYKLNRRRRPWRTTNTWKDNKL